MLSKSEKPIGYERIRNIENADTKKYIVDAK